jgi:hypothetical protein
MTSEGWLERYRGGEQAAVWHELRQLGARVREPAYLPEAQAVSDEMARRARHNVETIVERLTAEGYRFHSNDDEQTPETPFFPASPRGEATAAWLESTFDAVPLTLLSWLRIVGDVWLVGTHPAWDASSSGDPLVVELEGSRYPDSPIVEYFEGDREAWEHDGRGEPFVLPVSPDHLHKDDVSGGAPYGFLLPDACADAMWRHESTMPFVDYLNWVFAHGGFPMATHETDDAAAQARWRITYQASRDLLRL